VASNQKKLLCFPLSCGTFSVFTKYLFYLAISKIRCAVVVVVVADLTYCKVW